jgi:hypothetical protein
MSDDLSSGNSSKSTSSNVSFGVSFAPFPCVFLLVDVYVVVAVVVLISIAMVVLALIGVSLVAAAASVDFLDSAFVIVILLVARTSNLSVFCYLTLNQFIRGLWGALANDDGLRGLLPDNDRLHLHLHGLGGFVADVDGLRLELLLGLGAEVLGGPGVLF